MTISRPLILPHSADASSQQIHTPGQKAASQPLTHLGSSSRRSFGSRYYGFLRCGFLRLSRGTRRDGQAGLHAQRLILQMFPLTLQRSLASLLLYSA